MSQEKLTQKKLESLQHSKPRSHQNKSLKSGSDESSNDSTIGSQSTKKFMDNFPCEYFRSKSQSERKSKKRNSLIVGIQEEPEINVYSDEETKNDSKIDRVRLLKDNKEFCQMITRGRNKNQQFNKNQPQQVRNYSADLLPKVDEDQKEEHTEREDTQKHKLLIGSGLDKNEFGVTNHIKKTFSSSIAGGQFNVANVNESIEEDYEKEKIKGKARKISLSIFSSNSNSHVNSPHSRKILADELEFFHSKKNLDEDDSSDSGDSEIHTIVENDCEEVVLSKQTPGMHEFGQALEKLSEDMQYLSRIMKGDQMEENKQEYAQGNMINEIQEEANDGNENGDDEEQEQEKAEQN